MLDKDIVYRKTQRGVDALAIRQGGLTPRQRSLLILVDGRRNGQELATLGAACGEVAELLNAMLTEGYVERLGTAPAAVEARRATAAPAPLPLAQVRIQAVRRLNDMLGPAAVDLCLRLEKAQSLQEFRATLHRVEASLGQVVGSQRAAAFVSDMEKLGAA
ncbi:MAG: hypothetical protein EOO30_17770 [Comamonadaceae bacterium]|nr:MAG: hypothetical protein EOO30_17770 [Comamonadaceae bacterium]